MSRGCQNQIWAATALLIVLSLLGCTRTRPTRPPDVVLVVLDAAAAGHFSLYGYDRQTTPHLDSLAKESIVWDRAYSQAPQTTSSVGSLLTGRYPAEAWADLQLRGISIAQHLKTAGYRTLAFIENPWIARRFGFDQGFDYFDSPVEQIDELPAKQSETVELSIARRALSALDEGKTSPHFLYLHIFPPHSPYAPPSPFRGRFNREMEKEAVDGYVAVALGESRTRDRLDEFRSAVFGQRSLTDADRIRLSTRYDENLLWADAYVGELVQGLRDRGRLDRTLLIITADHGEAFGEHGHYGHTSSLYDEQIRVPLIMRIPESLRSRPETESGRRTAPVQIVDLSETILDLLGLPLGIDPASSGRSLLNSDPRASTPVRSFLGQTTQAILTDRYKLLIHEEGSPELFDLIVDPAETRNLATERADVVNKLEETAWKTRSPGRMPSILDFDEETRERLERLGYLE